MIKFLYFYVFMYSFLCPYTGIVLKKLRFDRKGSPIAEDVFSNAVIYTTEVRSVRARWCLHGQISSSGVYDAGNLQIL